MNLLKRFFAVIVKIVCAIIFIVCVIGAIADEESRVICIIVGIIALVITFFMDKIIEKAKAKSVNKCKKCGSSYSGASYKYRYDKSKFKDCTLPVDIDVYCPKCGKVRWLFENVYLDNVTSEKTDEKVEKEVRKLMESYMNKN